MGVEFRRIIRKIVGDGDDLLIDLNTGDPEVKVRLHLEHQRDVDPMRTHYRGYRVSVRP
jgi:hypothetical protein